MKKIIYIALLLISCFQMVMAQDKCFQKGNFIISIGAGLGAYSTNYSYERDTTQYSLTSQGITAVNTRIARQKKDGAVSAIFPIHLEYAVNNWLGIGARVATAKFFANADSTNNNIKPNVTSFDAGLNINLHFIKTTRFDLPLAANIGYSKFKYLVNDALSGKAVSNGFNYGFALVPRIYFGKHFGMYFNLGYAAYIYPNLKYSNTTNSNLNQQDNVKAKITGNGVNLGLGLQVKL
jgi:hypothetical protein